MIWRVINDTYRKKYICEECHLYLYVIIFVLKGNIDKNDLLVKSYSKWLLMKLIHFMCWYLYKNFTCTDYS